MQLLFWLTVFNINPILIKKNNIKIKTISFLYYLKRVLLQKNENEKLPTYTSTCFWKHFFSKH